MKIKVTIKSGYLGGPEVDYVSYYDVRDDWDTLTDEEKKSDIKQCETDYMNDNFVCKSVLIDKDEGNNEHIY